MKYAEEIRQSSKKTISVMFCGSAIGEMLPPFIIYQGKNMWDRWCHGGPKGSMFANTTNGWFDVCTFSEWFHKLFLKHVQEKPGKKLLIGDNLASHLSYDVIETCKNNNIQFVCLPANATHLMQPLDLSYFSSLKQKWRTMLTDKATQHPNLPLMDRDSFPSMIKELMGKVDSKRLLPRGFEKCGLVPLNKNKVLDRLPTQQSSASVAQYIDAALISKLQEMIFYNYVEEFRSNFF